VGIIHSQLEVLLPAEVETVKTVPGHPTVLVTGLKPGVNEEIGRNKPRRLNAKCSPPN
jgi:hypothetical protein